MVAFSIFQSKQDAYVQEFALKEARAKAKKDGGKRSGDQSYEQLCRLMK